MAAPLGVSTAPTFVVDLDVPGKERWIHIVEAYKQEFIAVYNQVEDAIQQELGTLGKVGTSIVSNFMAGLTKVGGVYFSDELKGIATYLDIPLGKLALLQLVYEAAAACTSVVLEGPDGHPVHIRTMDWEMDFLSPMTINLDFMRGDQLLFKTTSWAGYVGVLTAMRPGAYSVSVNFRVTGGSYWSNVKEAVTRAWPVGFLLREVMTTDVTYKQALSSLSNSALIAPCYFTVCGVRSKEGVLLTRRRDTDEQRWTLKEHGTIVQTNIDHWSEDPDEDIMASIERRALGRALMADPPSSSSGEESFRECLWMRMSTAPIFNSITIYGTYMDPTEGILETRMPNKFSGFVPVPNPVPEGGPRKQCKNCLTMFRPDLNPRGMCAHTGGWHAAYADCHSKLGCAAGLKTNIGAQHWGCCYSTSPVNAPCPKSGQHEE